MASQYDLLWPGEKPGVSAALAKQIPELRRKSQERRISGLKILLGIQSNRDIALAILSDDPSKLRLVEDAPTDMLYSLGCVNMIRARHKQLELVGKSNKEETEAIQIVIDKQMSEMRSQLNQSLKTQEYLRTKVDGLSGALADVAQRAEGHHKESMSIMQRISENIMTAISKIGEVMPGIADLRGISNRLSLDLRSFITQAGGKVTSDAIRASPLTWSCR